MRRHDYEWHRRCDPCGLELYGADVVNHRCPPPVVERATEPVVEPTFSDDVQYVAPSLDDYIF